jgi:predicted  nucleic acid-binding Zn-ribbon protein
LAFKGFHIVPELQRWINQERDLKNELAYLDKRLQRLQKEKQEIEERMTNIRGQLSD